MQLSKDLGTNVKSFNTTSQDCIALYITFECNLSTPLSGSNQDMTMKSSPSFQFGDDVSIVSHTVPEDWRPIA